MIAFKEELAVSNSTATRPPSGPGFSSGELTALSAIVHVSASLSLLGSLIVIVSYCAFKKMRQSYNSLVFWLAVSDLGASLCLVLGRVPISLLPHSYWLCAIQAFCTQLFVFASLLFNASIALNIALLLARRISTDDLRKLEKVYQLNWLVALLTALVPVFLQKDGKGRVYGDSTLWCWISNPYAILRMYFFFGPMWILFIFNLVVYGIAGKIIWGNTKQLGVFKYKSETSFIYTKKVSLYLLVFLVSWTPATVNRILSWTTGKTYFGIFVLHAALTPLCGFLNFILYYVTTVLWKQRRRKVVGKSQSGQSTRVLTNSRHKIAKSVRRSLIVEPEVIADEPLRRGGFEENGAEKEIKIDLTSTKHLTALSRGIVPVTEGLDVNEGVWILPAITRTRPFTYSARHSIDRDSQTLFQSQTEILHGNSGEDGSLFSRGSTPQGGDVQSRPVNASRVHNAPKEHRKGKIISYLFGMRGLDDAFHGGPNGDCFTEFGGLTHFTSSENVIGDLYEKTAPPANAILPTLVRSMPAPDAMDDVSIEMDDANGNDSDNENFSSEDSVSCGETAPRGHLVLSTLVRSAAAPNAMDQVSIVNGRKDKTTGEVSDKDNLSSDESISYGETAAAIVALTPFSPVTASLAEFEPAGPIRLQKNRGRHNGSLPT